MNYARILIGGIVILIVSTFYTMLTCGWLFTWVYEIEPIIWKSPALMMTQDNIIGSLASGLLGALVFIFLYGVFYKGIPGKGVKKGLMYGLLLWLLTITMGIIGMPFYMTIAWTVIVYWILNFLVWHLIMGLLVGAIYKPK